MSFLHQNPVPRYAVMQKRRGVREPGRVVHDDSVLSRALAEAEDRRTPETEVWIYDRLNGRAVVEVCA